MSALTPSRRFIAAVRRALLGPCAAAPAGGVLIGCSGGPDSTALLLALCALQSDLGLALRAVYVDHGLRPAAAAEGQQVLNLCQALEVPAQVVVVAVPQGASLQAEARRVRYRALAAAATTAGLASVAVGHTASDQAETVLLRLCQRSGLRGLGGMAWRRRLTQHGGELALIRPLLGHSRDQVTAFLAESGISTVNDPSNADRRYLRSRLRHDVLPLLRREHPAIERRLCALAEDLRADAAYLDEAALAATPPLGREAGAVTLEAAALVRLPRALAARVLLRALGPLAAAQIGAVLALCAATTANAGTKALDLPGGRRAERRYDRLLLWPEPPPPPPPPEHPPPASEVLVDVLISGPGSYRLGQRVVSVAAGEAPGRGSPGEVVVPASCLPLRLRHPRPGDRIRLPAGGRQRLSDLLINAKVPRAERGRVVLLTRGDGDEVLWVAGLRAAVPCGDAGPTLTFRLVPV